MKKFFKCALCILLAAVTSFLFMACTTNDESTLDGQTEQEEFTVKFETNTQQSVLPITVSNESVTSPDIRQEGKTLVGWYTSAEFEGARIEFPFNVTKDITLYARWETSTADEFFSFLLSDDGKSYSIKAATLTETMSFPTKLVLPDTYLELPVTDIPEKGFFKIPNIVSLIVGQYVWLIDDSAFKGCTVLEELFLPDSVTTMADNSFADTAFLQAQPDGMVYVGRIAYSFKGSMPEATDIVIKDGTLGLSYGLFMWEKNVRSVHLPASLEVVLFHSFSWNANLEQITVDENNKTFQSIDGNLYSKDGKVMIQYSIGKKDKSFTVPNTVEKLADQVFFYCLNLEEVILPDSVIELADGIFNECKNIKKIHLGKNVAKIGSGVFYDCKNLEWIVIPQSLVEMGVQMFGLCEKVTIFTEAEQANSGWGSGWNAKRPVYYGGQWTYVEGVPTANN